VNRRRREGPREGRAKTRRERDRREEIPQQVPQNRVKRRFDHSLAFLKKSPPKPVQKIYKRLSITNGR
jgi:hypothetical protein